MSKHDLIVIGGGAGGMSAAQAGVRRGAATLLVQDGPMGGDCTHTGCVPSKALIAAAGQGQSLMDGLANARRAIAEVAATEDADTFRRRGVDVVQGRARFVDANTIDVGGERHRSDRFVLATGATPAVPPINGLREAEPLTSDTLWEMAATPKAVAILGGGTIGCELAQAFARLGAIVTLFEGEDRVLLREEPAAAKVATKALEADGVTLSVGEFVQKVERLADGRVRIHTPTGAPVEADEVIAAIGRRPVTEGLDVETAGVRLDERGYVITDDHLRTTASGVYAVGDVTGKLPFTHGAYVMGRLAAGNALSPYRWRRFKTDPIPWVTFTAPEIARVGLTEAEAFEQHGEQARVVDFPLAKVDRAIVEQATDGFIKVIAGPRRGLRSLGGGRFLGATIAAPRAGEMIHEISNAMATGGFPARTALATHAYPTWSMAVQQAVGAFFMDVLDVTARPARPDPGDA